MNALPVHKMSAKDSQGTNIFLPLRILALNVVLYAVKAFKYEIKHMNAKEPRACARFFNATITTRALIHNNTMYPSEARWSEIKSLMPQTSSSSFWPGSVEELVVGAWVWWTLGVEAKPPCVYELVCFSPSAGAVGGGRRDWHAKSWTASKMAPESHSSGASGKPGCSSGPLWTHCCTSSQVKQKQFNQVK